MKFDPPLHEGIFVKRYKRFFCDFIHTENNQTLTAHCPNTGSMKSCATEGDKIFVSYNPSPSRKLSYTWELTQTPTGCIGVNTIKANAIVNEALQNGIIKEIKDLASIKREVAAGKSKFDFYLTFSDLKKPPMWLEVKNVTLLDENRNIFPDAPTERGVKHLRDLRERVAQGERAGILYLVNRQEGDFFTAAEKIDPLYAEELQLAYNVGVEILAYRTRATRHEIYLHEKVQIKL